MLNRKQIQEFKWMKYLYVGLTLTLALGYGMMVHMMVKMDRQIRDLSAFSVAQNELNYTMSMALLAIERELTRLNKQKGRSL